MNEPAFRLVTLLLLAAAFGISAYFRRKAGREGGELDKSEGQGLLILLRLLALLILLPVLLYLVQPAWVAWARLPLPDGLRWTAAGIAAAVVPAFFWLFASIGTNISPTQGTRTNHQLVTAGPYQYIRHPLYTFGLVFFLAIAVLTAVWTLAAGLLLVFPVLMWRTPREEARLIEAFGDDYRTYMQRTGRYFPRLGR